MFIPTFLHQKKTFIRCFFRLWCFLPSSKQKKRFGKPYEMKRYLFAEPNVDDAAVGREEGAAHHDKVRVRPHRLAQDRVQNLQYGQALIHVVVHCDTA